MGHGTDDADAVEGTAHAGPAADPPPAERAGDGAAGSPVTVAGDGALSVEFEIIGDSVVGQVAPPGRMRITVEVPEQDAFQIDTDDLGCFSLTAAARGALGRGPLRFQIDHGESSTTAGWTREPPTP